MLQLLQSKRYAEGSATLASTKTKKMWWKDTCSTCKVNEIDKEMWLGMICLGDGVSSPLFSEYQQMDEFVRMFFRCQHNSTREELSTLTAFPCKS